jgi:hypothetical protein
MTIAWASLHLSAWYHGSDRETAIRHLIQGFGALNDTSISDGGCRLGDDGYFCDHARDVIQALRAMLNLDCGRFDCGTLDGLLLDLASAAGLEIEG